MAADSQQLTSFHNHNLHCEIKGICIAYVLTKKGEMLECCNFRNL